MDEKPFEKIIEKEFAFLFEAGFCYEYTYDKGSDSSCVYIYRFRRGRDFFDFRTVSGGKERNTVAFANGQYVFPNLKLRHKKAFGALSSQTLFQKGDGRGTLGVCRAAFKSGKRVGHAVRNPA